MSDPDHYAVLGVPRTTSEQEIVRAYRVLIRQHHPDRVGISGQEMTMQLNHAYDVLSDPAKRRDYDRTLEPVSSPEAAPAAETPEWVRPDTEQSFEPQTAKPDSPVPSKRDWSEAFPPGSKFRLWMLSGSVLVAAAALCAAAGLGAAVVTPFVVAPGLLFIMKKPHRVAYWLVAIGAGLAGASIIWHVPAPMIAGWFALIASAGVMYTRASLLSFWGLRRRHTESRLWTVLTQVAAATNSPVLWVRAVDGNLALVQDPESGAEQTIHTWGSVEPGTWVALNAASAIAATAPGSAPKSFVWVQKDEARRARRAARRA